MVEPIQHGENYITLAYVDQQRGSNKIFGQMKIKGGQEYISGEVMNSTSKKQQLLQFSYSLPLVSSSSLQYRLFPQFLSGNGLVYHLQGFYDPPDLLHSVLLSRASRSSCGQALQSGIPN